MTGFEAVAAQMRTAGQGFTRCGDDLDAAGQVLRATIEDETYLGDDQAGQAFRRQYDPVKNAVMSGIVKLVPALHGITGGVDTWAAGYEAAEAASTVST